MQGTGADLVSGTLHYAYRYPRIPCMLGNRIRLVGLEEVLFVTTTVSGVHVTTADGEYFTEVTLKVLEERTQLMRCHKQYLIDLDCIKEIILLEGGLGRTVTPVDKKIPVSRRYLKILKKKLLI